MADQTAFVFPGQGSYLPGLFAELRGPGIDSLVEELDDIGRHHGFPGIAPYLFDSRAPGLDQLLATDPDLLQPVIYAISVTGAALLRTEYRITPDLVFGHSFGEIAAMVTAGFFTPADGMRIVCARADAFRTAAIPASGMLALELDMDRTHHLLRVIDEPDLAIAAENAPFQTVVAGPTAGLDLLRRAAPALGIRATTVGAPYGFHSPAVRDTVARFGRAIADIAPQYPVLRCWSDIAERYLGAEDDIRALLVRHLLCPVRFVAAVRRLHLDGATRFIECGARGTLSRLIEQTVLDIAVIGPFTRRRDADELGDLLIRGTDRQTDRPANSHTPITGNTSTVTDFDAAGTEPDADREAADRAEIPPLPPAEELLGELRSLYAEATEYPYDILTPDAHLEEDLGIDSLQQGEVFRAAVHRYRLTDRISAGDAARYPTLRAIGELFRTAAE